MIGDINDGGNFVAPGHQTGRGLKHLPPFILLQDLQVAPGHQTGRGLKLLVLWAMCKMLVVAPGHQTGRGLKPDMESCLERQGAGSARSPDRARIETALLP